MVLDTYFTHLWVHSDSPCDVVFDAAVLLSAALFVLVPAFDEPQYDWHNVCNKCGKDLGTDDWNVINHGDICDGSYSCIQVQVGTIHHDAETTQVWVVDKPAYTEYVYGEKCSVCGATK